MYTFIKIMFQTVKVFILFLGCTILFYYGMIWMNQEYENYHRYDEPEGRSIKVFQQQSIEKPRWLERLLLFYVNGE
ncbi:YqzK family protein [Bacillus chungangensis]|uniref:DUF4227 domain-containing protein n=1 Tax=Bacillus chungangensis TaxID=587633 RepID=A0ABT9WYB7_9BACI|nr:YqzK family protein [Bacillus chungangensis]MDQ0177872.1 hypothetical protein [Bacillus chungangensis]